jgi:PKD repeat protein
LAQAGTFEMDFGNGKKENYTLASGETLDIVMDYKASGIYNWQLQQQHGNQSCKEVAGRIVVQPNPIAGFVFTPQIIDINTPEVRFIYTGSGASKINWESGNGVKGSGQEMKTRYIDTGYYVAKQVVENAAGCRDSISAQIYVSGLLMVYMPTAIVPSGVNNRYLPLVYNGTLQEMEIYNRWGELIYRGTEPWAATEHIGQVYICIARVLNRHGKLHSYSETFTVLK